MEEKNATKISLSTFFLILAIIAIIVMGIFIYKLNNDKIAEIQKSTELQAQVNSLNGTVSNLQGKTDSNMDNNSAQNKIIGSWKAYKIVDSEGNDIGLNSRWGKGIAYSNEMQFKENGVLLYMIGITASSDNGSYTVNGNTIRYGIPTDIKGKLSWSTLTYIPEEDILKEELDLASKHEIIIYIRVKNANSNRNNTLVTEEKKDFKGNETVSSNNINSTPYDKYKNEKDDYGYLTWLVKERLENDNIDYEHLVYGKDLNNYYSFLDLKEGKLYYIPENADKKIEIDTITGNIKFVFLEYEKQTGAFESFYAITEDGSLWKNKVSNDSNYNSFSLIKKFDDAIVDITIVNKVDEVGTLYSTAYYLLANGKLLDQNGNAYKMN